MIYHGIYDKSNKTGATSLEQELPTLPENLALGSHSVF
jgi:hypothetical protein